MPGPMVARCANHARFVDLLPRFLTAASIPFGFWKLFANPFAERLLQARPCVACQDWLFRFSQVFRQTLRGIADQIQLGRIACTVLAEPAVQTQLGAGGEWQFAIAIFRSEPSYLPTIRGDTPDHPGNSRAEPERRLVVGRCGRHRQISGTGSKKLTLFLRERGDLRQFVVSIIAARLPVLGKSSFPDVPAVPCAPDAT
ncbi:hypothetical protein CfE428DRAFT_5989 [Chthoniobacter flavus Ellin428]|uniref:Uncharacterized protein n=1 Tax=Chthoniobacter flavus Ellin428 TaxID=497964 RepID=B4DAP8_9BACT|nr:hypothetical protein CfE428DRAFT_5989 [Chthoniobacter flavus Ellin428]TCO92729.1 hypothetical protein EV701_1056 [Chthoniobacter flavus]